MSKNIVINGVTYNGVTKIEAPIVGGGNAAFPDTSDADAVAGEITTGKTAYVNGVKLTGTNTGGTDTSDATAVQAEILNGKTAYIASGKTTGSMPNNAGNVNAVSYHQDGTSLHIVPAQGYTDGSDDATVITDSDFVNTNIKKDVSLFGLTGTYEGSGGGGAVVEKDVNFYDYDGFLCYSWTLAELANASALPANPTHTGLTAQGWNWSLADLKTENAKMNVGQMYITDDGKTRLYITIAAEGRMVVPLYWSQTVENGVSIDWGDGSSEETFTGTGNKNTTHTYADIGDYMITLTVTSGALGLGDGTSSYSVMGSTANAGKIYCNMLQKTEIGSNISNIGNYAFGNCYSLASITIPSGASIGTYSFYYCYSLASVIIPSGVSSISAYAFQYCYSLASVIIPSGVSSIDGYAFRDCSSLASITIPSNVSSIGNYAFYHCYSLASITIPSGVSSIGTYAFQYCYSLASITIPSGVSIISVYTFQYCYSLASITIPSGVSSIRADAFRGCEGMAAYHILPVVPPTLVNVSAFTSIPSDCVIYVPVASLAAYQAATNWSTYAAKMVGE